MNTNVSASSQVRDWLLSKEVGHEFIATDIRSDLPHLSGGAVSGMLYRVVEAGGLTAMETSRKGSLRYRIIDRSVIEGVHTRLTPGIGSSPGRQDGSRTPRRAVPTPESIIAELLNIAAKIEKLPVLNLAQVPTEDLLRELMRRQRAEKVPPVAPIDNGDN